MELVDTHCHIHSSDYPLDAEEVIIRAHESNVTKLLCVGEDLEDSRLAVKFVVKHPNTWASVGIHPHESARYLKETGLQAKMEALLKRPKVVAIGECGLDYYYNHSPKAAQQEILKLQLDLARTHNLPLLFHIREAFDDFWSVFDSYPGPKGIVHSFTATKKELAEALERGLYIGLNGIMTFTKNEAQIAAAKAVPLDRLVLETDAPFLTPAPYRGTINEPKNVLVTADFLARLRGEDLASLATATGQNVHKLFGI